MLKIRLMGLMERVRGLAARQTAQGVQKEDMPTLLRTL